MKWKEKNWERR